MLWDKLANALFFSKTMSHWVHKCGGL